VSETSNFTMTNTNPVTKKKKSRKSIGFYLSSIWIGFILFLAFFGWALPGPVWDEASYENLGVGPFSKGHFMGTTMDGYDMWSGLVNGAKISVFVSLISVFIGGGIGSFVGITAAYFRGKYDLVVTMVFNIMLSIPNLVLSLALLSVLAYSDEANPTTMTRRVGVLILSLTIVIIPILGRIARGSALQWGTREFILASKSMGSKNFYIIRRHILPNVAPAILAIGFLAVGSVIIVEGSLALLGIGIPGGASWGSMLSNGRGNIEFSPHEVYLPALFIAFTVISFNWFGDYVRTKLDKRESKI
jgi:ABC-type dipeptide/oligopeptide/nickel transport system permease subunit